MTLRVGYPDRRRRTRGTSPDEPRRPEVVSRIVGTYREMPGMKLRIEQAARLFGLAKVTCEAAMNDLVRGGVLTRTPDGQYLRRG